jgi:gas vesicle protein
MGGSSKFLAGLVIGAAAGAAIAIFLNTEKGKELVSDLKSAAGKAGDELKDAAKRFGDELDEVMEKGKEYADNLGQKVKNATQSNN